MVCVYYFTSLEANLLGTPVYIHEMDNDGFAQKLLAEKNLESKTHFALEHSYARFPSIFRWKFWQVYSISLDEKQSKKHLPPAEAKNLRASVTSLS